jgi:hypothetical protein
MHRFGSCHDTPETDRNVTMSTKMSFFVKISTSSNPIEAILYGDYGSCKHRTWPLSEVAEVRMLLRMYSLFYLNI